MSRRVLGGAVLAAATLFVGVNGLAWNHVHAMTHYADAAATRTANPGDLGLLDKVGVLLLGVSLPRPTNTDTPTTWGWAYDTARVPTPDGELDVWIVPPKGPVRGETLVFHGYGGNKSQLLPFAAAWRERGHRVVLVDFRGSGGSDGDTVTLGWREAEDVGAVLDWSIARGSAEAPVPRVLHGFSMGGAAILKAFADGRVHGVDAAVVENVFDTLPHTVGHRFERMGLPPRPGTDLLLLWGSVDLGANAFSLRPVDWASAVDVPLLVLAGADDPKVRPHEARAVAVNAPDAAFVLIDDLDHAPAVRLRPDAWADAVDSWRQTW